MLRGTLAIDLPEDGRRPGAAQRRVLQKYAEQAGRAVVTALEREALAAPGAAGRGRPQDRPQRQRRSCSLDRILADSREALVEGFQARGMWIQTFDEDGHGTGAIYSADGAEVELPAELVADRRAAARRAWDGPARRGRRTADARSARRSPRAEGEPDPGVPRHHRRRLAAVRAAGRRARVPRQPGADPRRAAHRSGARSRATAALDIGHDLGRAILNARTFEREHQLVEELQALDTYKSQLIATVSHELKNPLTAIMGHLEMLDVRSRPDRRPPARSLAAMDRGAQRLARVVDDLLLLSKVGDPNNPVIAGPGRPAPDRRRRRRPDLGGRASARAIGPRSRRPHGAGAGPSATPTSWTGSAPTWSATP